MRKLLPLLAVLALLLPACKGEDEGGSAQQVTYTCDKCTKTKQAPADQAPS